MHVGTDTSACCQSKTSPEKKVNGIALPGWQVRFGRGNNKGRSSWLVRLAEVPLSVAESAGETGTSRAPVAKRKSSQPNFTLLLEVVAIGVIQPGDWPSASKSYLPTYYLHPRKHAPYPNRNITTERHVSHFLGEKRRGRAETPAFSLPLATYPTCAAKARTNSGL